MSLKRDFLLYCIAMLALSDACPELRIIEERATNYRAMRTWDDNYPSDIVTFDEISKEFILLTRTHDQRFDHDDEFVSFDVYELPGENRQFFITHIYNERWDGGYLMYSRGQLTEATSGYKIIATPSLEKPLPVVSMCDDNVFELQRIHDYGDKYISVGTIGDFRLIKHRSGGKKSVVCTFGGRFPKVRLTAIDSCTRDAWFCWG